MQNGDKAKGIVEFLGDQEPIDWSEPLKMSDIEKDGKMTNLLLRQAMIDLLSIEEGLLNE